MVPWVRQQSASETASLTNQTPGASSPRHLETETETCLVLCAVLCCLLRRRVPRSTYGSYAFQS
jgi:hypothetical protein